MSRWHEEVLNRPALAVADLLVGVLPPDFFLAGGTGLALQMGHRVSLDFDLFSEVNVLKRGFRNKLIRSMKTVGNVEIRESIDQTMHLSVDGISVSLFHYPYPILKPHLKTWRGLRVAGLNDIAAMKLSAVRDRGIKKDFVDLFVLAGELGLEELFKSADKKFSDFSDFGLHAAKALVYFDDAEPQPMPRMLLQIEWKEIKLYFEQNIPKFIKKRQI